MSNPKEIYFFSDDDVYDKGIEWYASHFEQAGPGVLAGESSTHYTKLPTYPETVSRLKLHLPNARFIYVMRHPIDRLISQYIHEWSERTVPDDLGAAVQQCPRLVDYSRYSFQMTPFLNTYGLDSVLPVFFERLISEPQAELERVCAYLDYDGQPVWHDEDDRRNVSEQRIRKSALRDALCENPLAVWFRRNCLPKSWRDNIRGYWQLKERPKLDEATRQCLENIFDEDLAILGEWFNVDLNCSNFKDMVRRQTLDFVGRTGEVTA